MRRGGTLGLGLLLVGMVVFAIVVYSNRYVPPTPQTTEDRRPKLRKLVADQQAESAQAVKNYQPKTGARLE